MGLFKWFLKNGFGSIGHTAKTWSKIYLDTISDLDDADKKETGFVHVIVTYTVAHKKLRDYNSTDVTLILDKSEKCLAMLMWCLICDIPSNINAILTDEKAFDESSDAIYQCVMEIAPHEIVLTPSEFKIKALQYLDYRDNVLRVLKANNNIQVSKYRTAIINKTSRENEIYHDSLFKDAKERFLNLQESNSQEDYVIWTIEMNSNKYIYVHYSNDISFKQNLNVNAKKLSGKIQFPNIDY